MEVELCSPTVLWVQMMVVVVEVGESHAWCSSILAMVGPDAHQSSVPVNIASRRDAMVSVISASWSTVAYWESISL